MIHYILYAYSVPTTFIVHLLYTHTHKEVFFFKALVPLNLRFRKLEN